MGTAIQNSSARHDQRVTVLLNSVLCYVRPWNAKQMATLARAAFPDAALTCFSDHRAVDEARLSPRYYANLRLASKHAALINVYLSKADADEVIARCRLLRKLPRSEANRHIYAMAGAVFEVLAHHKPQIVLSLTVDSYVVDLIRHLCGVMGTRFIGLVPTFVNGYFRVTARGERTINPLPDLNAVEELGQELLDTGYTPAFAAKSINYPRRTVLKRWASNAARVPYFWIKRFVSHDPYNHNYWGSMIGSADYVTMLPPKEPGREDWERALTTDARPPLYIPLQMFPECTVDYWSQDISVINYYDTLERLIETHHRTFTLLVKEHPGVLGDRPRGFYRKLRTDPRITVVPTYTRSNYVLDKVLAVLVWTGTVGFEAALRGKAVITLCDPYYAQGRRFLRITTETGSEVLLNHVLTSARTDVTPKEQEELLRFLVMQLFKGSFKNDGSWSAINPTDVRDAKRMALSIRAFVSV